MFLLSRLFGQRKAPAATNSTPPNVVVADFGEVLATRAPVSGTVADVSELPYPKEQIKRAIVIMLAATTDSQLREHLKFAYASLADWQGGVGPMHQGVDVTKVDRTKSVSDLAKEIGFAGEQMKKWQPIAKAEQEALIGDLRKLGLW